VHHARAGRCQPGRDRVERLPLRAAAEYWDPGGTDQRAQPGAQHTAIQALRAQHEPSGLRDNCQHREYSRSRAGGGGPGCRPLRRSSLIASGRFGGRSLAVVVADRGGSAGGALHVEHRLDVELTHDVHVRPWIVPPRLR